MRRHRLLVALLLACLGLPALVGAAPTATWLDFSTVLPSGTSQDEIWGGMGLDRDGRVYVAFTSRYADPPGDVVICRYTPSTGGRTCLGTLRQIINNQGNLQANERIAKVHTEILEYNGKLYMATSDYHGGEDPSTVRGSHVLSYDPATNVWTDLSKNEPGGITAPNEGMQGLDVLRQQNKLAGMTYPSGKIVIFDLATNRSTVYNAPVTFNNVSRKVLATNLGKVYFSYLPNGPPWTFRLWELTVATGLMQQSAAGNVLHDGLLTKAQSLRDGSLAYLKDELGYLYRWNVSNEALTDLGTVLPSGAEPPDLDYSLLMSNDERMLFSFPRSQNTLYQYNIATGAKSSVASFATGGNHQEFDDVFASIIDKQGNLYLSNNDFQTNGARLIQLSQIPNSPAASAQQLAFPTAEGFGRFAQGGRGGTPIMVTNLNSSGPGSLQACVMATGARTCIFRVAGIIDWACHDCLGTIPPFLTIAGQTAPGEGIMVRGFDFALRNTNDIIIRHLRLRPGSTVPSPSTAEALDLVGPTSATHDIILDHVSTGWAPLDALTGSQAYNVTLQWSLVSEGLGVSGTPGGVMQWAPTGGTGNGALSLLHNYFADHGSRAPSLAAGDTQLVNNVIYNIGGQGTMVFPTSTTPVRLEAVANYYKPGPQTASNSPRIVSYGCGADAAINCTGANASSLYLFGNVHTVLRPSGTGAETLVLSALGSPTIPLATSSFGFPSLSSQTTAAQSATDVPAKAGARVPRQDSIDQRALSDLTQGTGRTDIGSESSVGGYPTYATGTPYPDADGDGIDDAWEQSHGLNANSAADGPAVAANGYTNLENFLHELAESTPPQQTGPAFYLSPTGSDSATGTSSSSPWKTFTKAFSTLQCGDTLILLDGTYDGTNSGYARIDNWHCTQAKPLTIKAQNERKAYLAHDGTSAGGGAGLYMTNSQYIIVEGLRATTVDNTCCGATNPFAVGSSTNITLRKLLGHNNNRKANSHIVDIQNSDHLLVEDVEIYNYHRHGVAAQNVNDSTFRRVYCNSRNWPATCPGDFGCDQESDPSGGDGCLAIYPGSRNIVENCMMEGHGHLVEMNVQGDTEVLDNRILGSVALEANQGGRVDTRGSPQATCTGNQNDWCFGRRNHLEHFVAIHPLEQGWLNEAGQDTRCDNCSIINSQSYGFNHKSYNISDPSFHGNNTLIVNATSSAVTQFQPNGNCGLDYANITGGNTSVEGCTLTHQNTANPTLGGCLVYLPDTSPLKGVGLNQADIGANILYRYKDGTLTTTPLWDTSTGAFPCGQTVAGVNDTTGNSCINVHTRLHVNASDCHFPATYGGPPPPPPPTAGAWWKFDEGSETTAADSSGNGRNATLVGGATWATGRVGNWAYSGNLNTSAATIPSSPITSFASDHSVCLWAMVGNNAVNSGSGNPPTLLNFATDASNGLRWLLVSTSTPAGTWRVTMNANGTHVERRVTAQVFVNNTWVHLCSVSTGGILTLYVNGQAATSTAENVSPTETTNILGAYTTTQGNWGGRLDNVRVYAKALTAGEVQTEYGGTVGRIRHKVVRR